MRRRPLSHKQSGFTLIEVMIVVVILGILAAAVVPNLTGRAGEARVVKAKDDIRALSGALNMYKLDNYRFPSTEQGLEALSSKPSGEPEPKNWRKDGYISNLPTDPWGNEYQYLSPGENGAYDIWTYGADGIEGGEDEDQDVTSWTVK